MNLIEHKHLIIRAEVTNPPTNPDTLHDWMKRLVSDIGMELMAGPITVYDNEEGKRGLTGMCIINTSHIAIHVWDEPDPALLQLDVYTCGQLDVRLVTKTLTDFNPVKVQCKLLDRKSDLRELLIHD